MLKSTLRNEFHMASEVSTVNASLRTAPYHARSPRAKSTKNDIINNWTVLSLPSSTFCNCCCEMSFERPVTVHKGYMISIFEMERTPGCLGGWFTAV